jgi:hypothetical protein
MDNQLSQLEHMEVALDVASMAASPITVTKNRSNVGSGYYIDIFYQNVRGLRTKSTEIFNNVCSYDLKIICLTETWLNESNCSQNCFPELYAVYRSHRDCLTLSHALEELKLLFRKLILALNVD